MIRILLVDDQNLVRQGIKSLLEQDSNFHIVGTVKDGHNALKQVELLSPDIVLLDIEMPGMNGITATKYINHSSPQTKVIILSSHEDEEYLTQAFMAGARAYMLKDSLMTDLKQAILAVNNGYSQIESRLLAKIFAPGNIKFHKSKSEAENQKIAHHSRKSNDSVVENLPPKETPEYKQAEEKSIISVSSVKQPLLSPDEVSKVNVSEPTIPKNPESEVNFSNLNLAKTVNQNNVVELLGSNYNNSQFNHNTQSKSNEEKNLPVVTNQFFSFPLIQGSASKLNSTSTSKQNQLLKVVLKSKNHLQKITNKPPFLKYKIKIARLYKLKASQYEPQIKFCQAKLVYHHSRLCPVIKQWYETGLLANAGLVFLGIITVLIIHQVFSS
ncbi:MAG TPA: response regulator transcription factor [Coleofasciculaceae cyanobacterium]|jgi:DNA-binding NarL/FixJ family response regulator